MRRALAVCLAGVVLVAPAAAAPLDREIYPNASVYREPGVTALPGNGLAKVIRESCPGQARGMIHFLNLDGRLIRVRKTWPIYLELAPGERSLEMEYLAPSSRGAGQWSGTVTVRASLQAGTAYVVRYRRTAEDGVKAWLEPLPDFAGVGQLTEVCFQTPDRKDADPR
ncbi:hypothetical protein [Arenimonas sp. MALMAid1274]|uniref:hypothetical protein n=1 Tax=Arenimonas sp. MALMAid1274 TaxID=3411630 RepID=UPI003BA32894